MTIGRTAVTSMPSAKGGSATAIRISAIWTIVIPSPDSSTNPSLDERAVLTTFSAMARISDSVRTSSPIGS